MVAKRMDSPAVFTLKTRIVLGGVCILLALLIIAGAWTIPFVFESPSLYYKFGMDKTLLRSGQILGVTVAVLVFFQILLASRVKFLDRIFSLNRVYGFHRINGVMIAFLALSHPILVIASDNFTFFPFEKRYWPQFLGVGVLTCFLVIVTTANWRLFFGFAFHSWLRFHRLATVSIIPLMFIHILYVSETFKAGLPHTLVFATSGMICLLILRIWYRRFFPEKRRFFVSNVEPAGREAYTVDVTLHGGGNFNYMPGQFVFITPLSAEVPKEEHPFTIASTPTRFDVLQFVIRAAGDWTGKINRLKPGESVVIDGPYGLFSHMALSGNEPMVMIAGGIGITPMLSMIRYMADVGDRREILLIWSNKTTEHVVLPEEFKKLEHRLSHFRIIHVITRDREDVHECGRLDRIKLEKMLNGWSRKSKVFICGPFDMMKEMGRALKIIGFSPAGVYKEEFKL
jgi:predicted ferric reductase